LLRAAGLGAADFISKPFRGAGSCLARVEAHIRVGRALAQAAQEARSRARRWWTLPPTSVTDSLKPDENSVPHPPPATCPRASTHLQVLDGAREARDHQGVVVAAYENPMLRHLQIDLAKYPRSGRPVSSGRLVLVEDVGTDPLYEEERRRWERPKRSRFPPARPSRCRSG